MTELLNVMYIPLAYLVIMQKAVEQATPIGVHQMPDEWLVNWLVNTCVKVTALCHVAVRTVLATHLFIDCPR